MQEKKPLADLIHDLEQEMLRLGYTKGSMQFYRRRWNMLLEFAKELGEIFYSERLGMDFVEKHFHILEKDHLIMPVIFRMLYMCGLRLSEARLLKIADVDLDNGVLTIHHSKGDNSRLVPMSDPLTERCRQFSKKVHLYPVAEDYYFPALEGKPMTGLNVYHNFRRFLWRARISHGGKECGPRIHDFRHTHAVHCLKKWTEQDKDLTAFLPVLKAYMGHDSFVDTAYYLRLTMDAFPGIILKIETRYPGMIPQLEGEPNETY